MHRQNAKHIKLFSLYTTVTTNAFHNNEWQTYVDVHPIIGFSHRSRVSNWICHLWVPNVPDCMQFFVGEKIRTVRDSNCSLGVNDIIDTSSWNTNIWQQAQYTSTFLNHIYCCATHKISLNLTPVKSLTKFVCSAIQLYSNMNNDNMHNRRQLQFRIKDATFEYFP